MELTCPKCHGTMRTYERNGVHVDQCAECRGIFLDRGELDRLIDAENAWHGGTRPAEKHDDDRGHESRRDLERGSEYRSEHGSQHSSGGLGAVVGEVLKQVGGQKHGGYDQHGYSQQHSSHRPRKKESFLGDLFG
jgi:uncharacterized protein